MKQLCVPNNQLKGCNSPKALLKANKENNPVHIDPHRQFAEPPKHKQYVRKALGTKYSLSLHDQNQTLPILREKSEHVNLMENQPGQQLGTRLLSKIESHQDMFQPEAPDTRPQSVHKRIIVEKLSKSQNKTKIKENTSKICYDNFVTAKREEKVSPTSSCSSHNIWEDTNEKELALFEFYQLRYEQYPQQQEKISASRVINNVKLLLGSNIAIKSLGTFPWYTYGQSQPVVSIQDLAPKNLPLNRKTMVMQQQANEKVPFLRRRARVGDYNQELKGHQENLYRYEQANRVLAPRFEFKQRPRSRYVTRKDDIHSVQFLDITNQQLQQQLGRKKQSNPQVTQQFVGSPELLMKKQMFSRLVLQQKLNM